MLTTMAYGAEGLHFSAFIIYSNDTVFILITSCLYSSFLSSILLHKNGLSLGEDQRIEDLWNSGLDSYSDQHWELSIDMMEEAVRLFNQYENHTFSCLKRCRDEGIV